MNPTALVPCGGCRRHVRASEPACPFCAHHVPLAAGEGIVPEPTQRLSRAGVLAFAAAFLSTACDPRPPTPVDPPGPAADSGMMQTIYGGPPMPPVPPLVPIPPPGPNDMAVPAYGGPPPMPPEPTPPTPTPTPHARPHANTQPHPVAAPAYGLPPRQDPPPILRPGGSISTRYGSPPRPDDGA
jgi:hypothetical protein